MKIQFPLVSFLVPSYNHEKYIEKCLDSIANDEYPNKELIIIDDGSTDSSFKIIKRWVELNNNKININYRRAENSGICKTLNKMIEYSKGDYIRIIASDDTNINGSTQIFIDTFEGGQLNGCIFGDCTIIDKQGRQLFKSSLQDFYKVNIKNYKNSIALKQEVILNWAVCGPSTMYRKSTFDLVGKFDETLIIEDWDMFLRLLKLDYVKFIPNIVANYRFHENNTSRFNTRKTRIKILNHIRQTIINNIVENKNTYENQLLKIKILHVDAKLYYLHKNFYNAFIKYVYFRIKKCLLNTK